MDDTLFGNKIEIGLLLKHTNSRLFNPINEFLFISIILFDSNDSSRKFFKLLNIPSLILFILLSFI